MKSSLSPSKLVTKLSTRYLGDEAWEFSVKFSIVDKNPRAGAKVVGCEYIGSHNRGLDDSVTILISYLVGLKGCRVGIVVEVVELEFGVFN